LNRRTAGLDAAPNARKNRVVPVELALANATGRGGTPPAKGRTDRAREERPGWADGLRQLYDKVIEEQLPESFDDLLKRLDQANDGRRS
jgi:hypothetical protein